MSLSMAWFLLCAGLSVSGGGREEVVFWYRMSAFGFGPFFAVNLHFYIRYVYDPEKGLPLGLLYIPVPFVIWSTVFRTSLFGNFIFLGGHWRFTPALESPWFWLYFLYYFPSTFATIIIILGAGRRATSRKVRLQSYYIAVFSAITLFIGSGLDFLLPAFSWYRLPPLGPLLVSVYILGLWFVLLRYGFLESFPGFLLEEVIDNINELVFLLDSSYRVSRVNRLCREVLELYPDEHIGLPFPLLTMKPELTAAWLSGLKKERPSSGHIVLEYRTSRGPLHADTYLSHIYGTDKDVEGFLIVSRENKQRGDFIRSYRLTRREMEIVDLCLAGAGNPDISRKLSISLRTVEAHFVHIYNKTGAKNKIDLFNLAGTYGLHPDLTKN
jgi:DNA-binding CsgD family transcriptional regulator